MIQHDLNRAVASRTGESVREISRRGFVPLTRGPIERDDEPTVLDPCDPDLFAGDTLDPQGIGGPPPYHAHPATAF